MADPNPQNPPSPPVPPASNPTGQNSTGQNSTGQNSTALPVQNSPADIAAKIKEIETKYTIPQSVKEKYPDLIALVLQTESMNDDERDYWFQILPIMTDEQIAKFYGILVNERNQLQRLDKEYDDQMKKLNDKHQNEWTEFEVRKKREAIQKAEAKTEVQEKAQEEELLKKLREA